jgi:hypothetical protein
VHTVSEQLDEWRTRPVSGQTTVERGRSAVEWMAHTAREQSDKWQTRTLSGRMADTASDWSDEWLTRTLSGRMDGAHGQ